MKNRKGFTLIELIATIAIIVLITLIIAPTTINIIEQQRTKLYESQERTMEEAALKYINEVYTNSNTITITKEQLINAGYIDEIYDLKNKREVCEGYVEIYNLNNNPRTISFLDCSSYKTKIVNLTVNLDEGTIKNNISGNYKKGTKIKLENPIKENYEFLKWQIEEGDSEIKDNILILGEDTIIKAVYELSVINNK